MRADITKKIHGLLAIGCFLLIAFPGVAQSGSALLFQKSRGQYVSVPHSSSINLGATFTIEAIVNYSGQNVTIIDKGDYDFLWQLNPNSNSNEMGFYNKSNSTWVYSTGTVPQGVPTHVAITLGTSTLTFYINGVFSGTRAVTFVQDNQPMNIGRQQPTACQCNHFNGVMDEVRIWNVEKTGAQIQASMNTSVPTNSPGLVAYYKFDEGAGTTTADATGNGNTGTLVNGPTWFSGTMYPNPGTFNYTVPAGVQNVSVELWGAGYSWGNNHGNSGGGGGYTKSVAIPVTAGQVYSVVVGNTNANNSIFAAGSSTFSYQGNELVRANAASHNGGGEAVTGSNVAVSYRGGNPGVSATDGNNIYYGGGGASGGTNGEGYWGLNATYGTATTSGGGMNGTAGLGGVGGARSIFFDFVFNNGTIATAPGGGSAGPIGVGAAGWALITTCPTIGSIGVTRTVPFPYEGSDSVFNVIAANSSTLPYSWQQSVDNSNFTAAPGSVTTQSYPLPASTPADVMYYRRRATSCGGIVNTNVVKITTFTQANGKLNGTILGRVGVGTNGTGTGVQGITITVQKTIALLGSPITKTYTTVTDGSGNYQIPNIFYGDVANGDPGSVQFNVTPSKIGHTFEPASSTVSLSNTNPTGLAQNFKDNTVYAVRGTITQTCAGCVAGFTTDNMDSVRVEIIKLPGTTLIAQSYTIDDGPGKFGATVTEPGTYKVKPNYLTHTFSPVDSTITIVNGDISDVNFANTTNRTISGIFRAGGNQIIGTAQLEFTDTVKNRPTKFKKQVTTAADGSYSVTLPARTYKVRVTSFTPNAAGADIPLNDLFTFFNVIIKDSTIRNIDSANKTLDLIYHRAPVLQILNLPDTSCGNYVVFKQGRARSFSVNVWEGDPVHNYKMATTLADSVKLTLVTSVQGDDLNDSLRYYVVNGVSNITLMPGTPNTIPPNYRKFFSLTFKDKYGRAATEITRNTVVLGVKSDPGTFTTVSPEIPLLILHDPPGDASFSFWEQNKTAETAMRFSTLTNNSLNGWIEARLGVRLLFGLGVSYEASFWATLNANFGVSATINEANEAIVSVSNSQYFSTADNSIITGDAGDVYIGAALNLLYSVGHELKFTTPCGLGIENRLMVADSGFATKYVYSESHIVNSVVPSLQFLASNSTGPQKDSYENQVNVWQQVLRNNAENKTRAAFDKNISFDGTAGAQTFTTTASSTKSNTIEFNLEVNRTIAIELGLEIAGIGVKGGVNIGFKTETGESKTTTATQSTTIGYTIDDDDDGDFFSIDVKKDPVYGTPVFALVAGTASCPDEPIAQKRDNAQLLIPNPVQRNIPPTDEAIYELQIGNTSESREDRIYLLSFDQSSNPFPAATVTLNNTPTIGVPIPIFVPYGQSVSVTAGVRRNQAGSLFSYEGLRFVLTDQCGGSLNKVSTLSAYFATACSQVNITSPLSNWQLSSANNNSLPLQLSGYTTANLQSISLEHSKANINSWTTDTTVFQGQITGSITPVTWNTVNLADGAYDLRAKVVCSNGITYSQRITGSVDRTAPLVFGKPEPTDDSYVTGDAISYMYNENIEIGNLTNKIELRRMSNNVVVPVQAGVFQNKIVIVPTINLSSFTGDTMRLIMNQIADVYGNARAEADTTYFVVGAPVVNANPALTLSSTRRAMNENNFDSLEFRFTLPAVNYNRQINYIVSGTATYGEDYTVRYPAGQPLTTTHNGAQGNITIVKNTTVAVLRIKPVADALFEPNETITVTLAEGGNYSLGATLSLTDTIRNDDLIPPVVYKSGPVNICQGQTLTLSTDNTIDGQPVYAYQWKNGTTVVGSNPTLNVTTSGIYTLTVFTQTGFTGLSESIEVSVSNVPGPSLGADQTVYLNCYGGTTNLSTLFNTTGFTSAWNTANPLAAPAGIHRLVAANNVGCTDTAYANVVLEVAVWTGTVSSNWHTPENWSITKVPSGITHVIVASGAPNSCIVSTADAAAASVQNRSGATIQVINNRTLFVGGKCANLPPN